jgi:hypothetical protein
MDCPENLSDALLLVFLCRWRVHFDETHAAKLLLEAIAATGEPCSQDNDLPSTSPERVDQ